MREAKVKEDDYYYYTNTNGSRSYNYDSGYDYSTYGTYSSNYRNPSTVETFKYDKKEKKKEDRPMVLHYPSQKEARDTIAELEKSKWWRFKRKVAAFFSFDITAKYYKPRYVKEEVAVKGKSDAKEDNKRFMPQNVTVYYNGNDAEYNNVVKHIGRSFDIAMDGEEFVVDEEIIESNNINNDETESTTSSTTVLNSGAKVS